MNQKDFHQTLYDTLIESIKTDPNYSSLGLRPSDPYQMLANRNISTKAFSLDKIPDNSRRMLQEDIDKIPDKSYATAYVTLVHYKPSGYKMDGTKGTSSTLAVEYSLEYPSEFGGIHVKNIVLYLFVVNFYRGSINIYLPNESVNSFEDPGLQESNFTSSDFFNYLKSMLISYMTY